MIEIDGIQWDDHKKIITLKEYSRKMIDSLRDHDIPFTLHWGKNANWGYPNLVNHMYKEKVTAWKQVREKLLTPEMQEVFSNDFLDIISLSAPTVIEEDHIL